MNENQLPMSIDELVKKIAPNEDSSVRFTRNAGSIKFESRDEAIEHIAKEIRNGHIIGHTYETGGKEDRLVGYKISQGEDVFYVSNADFPYY